jgi:hypothetical protein
MRRRKENKRLKRQAHFRYFSAPVVFVSLYCGSKVINIASVSGIVSIKATPFSGQ